jgi:serine O-acetyltransferase
MKINFSLLAKELQGKHVSIPLNRDDLTRVLESLIQIIFPICENTSSLNSENLLADSFKVLDNNFKAIGEPDQKLIAFFNALPSIKNLLLEDAQAFFDNDPASKSIEEIIIAYTGFNALIIHRLSHYLYLHEVPLIPRLWNEYSHSKAGIDIHPGAKIGKRFFLDHGTGSVIGETTEIGDDVKIYQNVTLGALHVSKDLSNKKRHPTVKNNVVIYAGTTILGGDTIIGHDSVLGGNLFITKSITPYSLIHQNTTMQHKTIRTYN